MADQITQKTDADLMRPDPRVQQDSQTATPAAQAGTQTSAPAAPASVQPSATPPPAAIPHPASPTSPAAQPKADAQPLVGITYEGKEYRVSPDVAEAWQKRQSAFDEGYGATRQERDALKQQLASLSKPAELTEEEKREQLATRLLTEPDKVLAEIKAEVKRELTDAYQGDLKIREFQTSWWGENQELLPYKEVFEGLLLLNSPKYLKSGLTDAQAYDKNAEAVRKLIVGIRGSQGGPKAPRITGHIEEPAPVSTAPSVTEPAVESSFMSMTEAMRNLRNRKSEAALHPPRPIAAA